MPSGSIGSRICVHSSSADVIPRALEAEGGKVPPEVARRPPQGSYRTVRVIAPVAFAVQVMSWWPFVP